MNAKPELGRNVAKVPQIRLEGRRETDTVSKDDPLLRNYKILKFSGSLPSTSFYISVFINSLVMNWLNVRSRRKLIN